MSRGQHRMLIVGLAFAVLMVALACTVASPFAASSAEDETGIRILLPADHSTAVRGGTISIRALVNDPQGIASVQLWVNEEAVTIELPSVPVTHSTQELFWTPNATGPHELVVVALNNAGEWHRSEPLTIYVVEAAPQVTSVAAQLATRTPDPFAIPTPLPTSPYTPPPPFTPTPTSTRTPVATECFDNAAFVSHVTVPDGEQFDKGATFNKTWRLRNTGNCTWNKTSYELVFVSGSQLSAPSAVEVPQEVAPGATVDITVRMVAPNVVGTYRSDWQMRKVECNNYFGDVIHALIEVRPGPEDAPIIHRFEVVPNVIDQGQSATIFWEYTNGTFARLYPDGQAIGPSGSLVVSPSATTSYRLVVSNGAGSVERTITLIVQPAPAPPPPPASPANLTITAIRSDGFDLTWTDTSSDEQGFRLYNADTSESLGAFPANVVSGSVGGLNCGTSYRFRLVAFNQAGESWPSNTVQATTSPCGG